MGFRPRSWSEVVLGGVPQRLDELRHLLLGEPLGGLGEALERTGDAPAEEDGGRSGEEHAEQRRGANSGRSLGVALAGPAEATSARSRFIPDLVQRPEHLLGVGGDLLRRRRRDRRGGRGVGD